jgi:hypothetical protein
MCRSRWRLERLGAQPDSGRARHRTSSSHDADTICSQPRFAAGEFKSRDRTGGIEQLEVWEDRDGNRAAHVRIRGNNVISAARLLAPVLARATERYAAGAAQRRAAVEAAAARMPAA